MAAVSCLLAGGIAGLVTERQFQVPNLSLSTSAVSVSNEGRSFLVNPSGAAQIQAAIRTIEARSRPGQRLFVGEKDMRYASYNDTFVYFLLPKLRPATPFLELNPGGANAPGHRFANELRRAAVLLVTNQYPPGPREKPGPAYANVVLRRQYCEVARYGSYDVFKKCAPHSSKTRLADKNQV